MHTTEPDQETSTNGAGSQGVRSTAQEFGLSPLDVRVLGSLIEKALTTPDVYPLTVNATLMACNQKTGREPVMALEQGAVHHALRDLEVRGWVKSQHTARAERYAHRVDARLGLTQPQLVLLGLLMLRGPQTAHELLARSERLAKFDGIDGVLHALQRLGEREQPLVMPLSRSGGQRENRYAQLLAGVPEFREEPPETTPTGSPGSLRERIDALEARVLELERRLDQPRASEGHGTPDSQIR